jgi:hypothetical protein
MCGREGEGRGEGGGDTFNAARKATSSVVVIMLTFPSIFGRNSLLRTAMTGSQPRASTVFCEASPPAQSPPPPCTSRSIWSLAASCPDDIARADWDNRMSSATFGTTNRGRVADSPTFGSLLAKGIALAAAKQGSRVILRVLWPRAGGW